MSRLRGRVPADGKVAFAKPPADSSSDPGGSTHGTLTGPASITSFARSTAGSAKGGRSHALHDQRVVRIVDVMLRPRPHLFEAPQHNASRSSGSSQAQASPENVLDYTGDWPDRAARIVTRSLRLSGPHGRCVGSHRCRPARAGVHFRPAWTHATVGCYSARGTLRNHQLRITIRRSQSGR